MKAPHITLTAPRDLHSCQETEISLEEGIFVAPVHRKGDNGHFNQTSLEGFSWKPPTSNSEVICPKANLMLGVHSPGIYLLCQDGLGLPCSDCCPHAECPPYTNTCSQVSINVPTLQSSCCSNPLGRCD